MVPASLTLALSLLQLAFTSVVAFVSAPPPPRHANHAIITQPTVLHARKGRKSQKGFGKKQAEIEPTTNKSIYSLPALYDLAFGYRSYDDEVDFLLHVHEQYSSTKSPPKHILELAAGPARHLLTALSSKDLSVESATAVDVSPEMKDYASQIAKEQLLNHDLFQYICGDMRQPVDSSQKFDSAWILLGSLQHLQTNYDVISCFESAHEALKPGGTLIVELPHPRETFSMVECTKNGWEVPLEDETGQQCGELRIVWGDETDTFDPITQVRQFTVSFDLTGVEEKQKQTVRQVVPMRLYTAQEIDALARCSGFEVVARYGALDKDVDVNDEDEAFRLVCVLRKV
jgi:SAM-dependent methyltransferase